MKYILLFGAKSKSDFVMFLAYSIAKQGNRVLIADTTISNEYKYSYIRLEENEHLYNFQNIEILCDVTSEASLHEKLEQSNEKATAFDYIILDIDSEQYLKQQWPNFHYKLYVSEDSRNSIMRDMEILNTFTDCFNDEAIKRLHFSSTVDLPKDYIELLVNYKLKFLPAEEPLEYDDMYNHLKLLMQHEYFIPFNKLNKQHQRVIGSIVSEITENDMKAVTKANKSSFFNKILNKKSKEQIENRTVNKVKPMRIGKVAMSNQISLTSELNNSTEKEVKS